MTTTTSSRWNAIRAIATTQDQFIGAYQLRQLGIDRPWVSRSVRAGRLVIAMPEAYSLGACPPLDSPAWLTAALLSTRGRGAIYRESAIEKLIGWRRGKPGLHIVAPGRHAVVEAPVTIHRTRTLPAKDLARLSGEPVQPRNPDALVFMTRTILDLADVLSTHQLTNVLHEAAFHGELDLLELRFRLEREHGHPWTCRARAAIELYESGSAGTRSLSEDRWLEHWLRRGFPEPLVNDPTATGLLGYECDFVWPELRLIVEIDGDWGHDRPNSRARDITRDEALRREGWTVIRIPTSRVWDDIDACIAEVRRHWFAHLTPTH